MPITGNHSIRSGGTNVNTISIPPLTASTHLSQTQMMGLSKRIDTRNRTMATAQIFQTGGGRQIILAPSNNGTMVTSTGHRLTVLRSTVPPQHQQPKFVRSAIAKTTKVFTSGSSNTTSVNAPIRSSVSSNLQLSTTLAKQLKSRKCCIDFSSFCFFFVSFERNSIEFCFI